ncbi:hypothetical protein [Thermus thermophilus]|uniref:hypothetical protein n=1 Tax=Thermus thermophilus TaxID=274 RepID=UPI001CC47095|nr:hypothetical protein [Thermus thermophilus]BDB11636.1 hypothetical protein TthTMY_13750 [Thermus thermophilus]
MKARSLVLFLLGLLLFASPFALFFREPLGPGGLPPFYLYLFLAWAGFLLLLFLNARRP